MMVSDCSLYQKLKRETQKSISSLEEFLTSRLAWIRKYFSDYTEHGINHARRTLNNFGEILKTRDLAGQLSESQILIAICACLLHDIGMGPVTEKEIEVIKKGFQSLSKLRGFLLEKIDPDLLRLEGRFSAFLEPIPIGTTTSESIDGKAPIRIEWRREKDHYQTIYSTKADSNENGNPTSK